MARTRPGRRRRASGAFLLGLLAGGCAQGGGAIEVRFPSEALRDVSREVRVFAFAAAGAEPPTCAALDPRGLGPGDAEARSGLTAAARAASPLQDPLASLPDLPAGLYTVVVEAWGPRCEAAVGVGSGDEPRCTRLAAGGEPVLRGYYCNVLELRAGAPLDLSADLEPLALVGAVMEVPTAVPLEAIAYDDARPLRVTAGEAATVPFRVQLFDHAREKADGVAVRWSVAEGEGGLLEGQPALSGDDSGERGVSSATLVPGRGVGGRRVVVIAHAPGFEGSPVRFVARAVPAFRTETTRVRVPLDLANLASVRMADQRVLVADLDGDGRLDALTAVRADEDDAVRHRLVGLLADGSRGHRLRITGSVPQTVRALEFLRLEGGARVVIAAVVDATGDRRGTPGGDAYVARAPGFEVWRGFASPGEDVQLDEAPQRITSVGGVPLTKFAIALDAADLGADGVDELAASRCSYAVDRRGYSAPWLDCFGALTTQTDGEIAVFRARTEGERVVLEQLAVVPAEGNDGGFREVRFLDVDGDGSLDLVFTTDTQMNGVCGNRNQPQAGFGFATPVRFRTSVTFAGAHSVAGGRFRDGDGLSVVTGGAYRASGPNSGFTLVASRGCAWEESSRVVEVGRRTRNTALTVRVADVNGDGWDDVLQLNRDTRTLAVHLGAGAGEVAPGPVFELGSGALGPLDVGVERVGDRDEVVAATVDRTANEVVFFRFLPLAPASP
jgi:hypothetical protein